MRLLSKDLLTLRRYKDGYYTVEGDWVEGTFIESSFRCCVQPDFSGKTRFIEESGVRSEDCYLIHSKTPLRTVDEFGETEADRFLHEGSIWEAVKTKNWTTIGRLSHYEVIIVRQDKDYLNGSQ